MPLEPKSLVVLAMSVILVTAMFWFRRELIEALNNRGGRGPRPPSHPLPADDARLLRRRRSQS